MHKLIAIGEVRPLAPTLTVMPAQIHTASTGNGNNQALIRYTILNNQVTAVVDWPEVIADVVTVRNFVVASVQILVDSIGFCRGCSFELEIKKVATVDLSSAFIFDAQLPELASTLQESYSIEKVNSFVKSCSGENGRYIRRCLRDLSLAIRYVDDTPFYCLRAIEALRHCTGVIKNIPDSDEKAQWMALAKIVNMSEEDLKLIRKFAFPARHGQLINLSPPDRMTIVHKTWQLVDQFVKTMD